MTAPKEQRSKDVGAVLRKRRMMRGQSLEAIHQTTRIPKRFLEALERNALDEFPARVYARGFLKGYCDFLEIEFEPLWQQLFPNNAPAISKEKRRQPAKPKAERAERPPVFLPFTESTILPFMLFSGLAVIGAIVWAVSKNESQQSRPPAESQPPALLSPVRRLGKPKLKIGAPAGGFIRLKVDGALRFEGRLPPGSTQAWEAQRDFSLRVSEPGSVRLELDGSEIALSEFPRAPDGWFTIRRQ